MKYVCLQTCQIRKGPQILLCEKGEIYELDKPNPRFQCIEEKAAPTYSIDFLKASESELKEAKWKFSDAYDAIKEKFDIELEKGSKKSDIVAQILDARFRAVNHIDPVKLK